MNESPVQTAKRLLDALDCLIAREAAEARSGSGARVASVQARISPLVNRLAALLSSPTASALRGRVAELAERRRQNCVFMTDSLGRLGSALADREAAEARLRRIAPAYRSLRPAPRLNSSV